MPPSVVDPAGEDGIARIPDEMISVTEKSENILEHTIIIRRLVHSHLVVFLNRLFDYNSLKLTITE